jgi:hypothetical protein
MKIFFGFLFLATLMAAQDAQLVQVPAGTVLAAELSKSIDAHKAKTGDSVVAKTTQDMLANGKVMIPHDSKITGHITDVQGRPKGQKGDADSTIGIAFDQLEVRGRTMPFHANIQAIAKPLIINPAAVQPGEAGGYGANAGASSPMGHPAGAPAPQTPNTEAQSAPPAGAISVQNTGVVGMKGFELNTNDQGSVVSSKSDNVKLESGTQLILKSK